MNRAEHYRLAESLLEEVQDVGSSMTVDRMIAIAQVHATLSVGGVT